MAITVKIVYFVFSTLIWMAYEIFNSTLFFVPIFFADVYDENKEVFQREAGLWFFY